MATVPTLSAPSRAAVTTDSGSTRTTPKVRHVKTSTSARRVGLVRATPFARTSRGLSSALARTASKEMATLAQTLTSAWKATAVGNGRFWSYES